MFTFKEWFDIFEIDENTSLHDWQSTITETTTSTRYSIEINYRSNIEEMLDAFAKICLGYVSAALKQNKYHVKHVYEDKPIRILISSRNWDDGEWVGAVSFNPKIVIMDEPTANLAVVEIDKVLDLTLRLKEHGISIIIISHRLDDVFRVSDRIYVLKHGRIAAVKEKVKTNKEEIIKLMFMEAHEQKGQRARQ